jgi:hypothetical protein
MRCVGPGEGGGQDREERHRGPSAIQQPCGQRRVHPVVRAVTGYITYSASDCALPAGVVQVRAVLPAAVLVVGRHHLGQPRRGLRTQGGGGQAHPAGLGRRPRGCPAGCGYCFVCRTKVCVVSQLVPDVISVDSKYRSGSLRLAPFWHLHLLKTDFAYEFASTWWITKALPWRAVQNS